MYSGDSGAPGNTGTGYPPSWSSKEDLSKDYRDIVELTLIVDVFTKLHFGTIQARECHVGCASGTLYPSP